MIQPNNTDTQLNLSSSQTLVAQATTSAADSWEVLPYEAPVIGIHAALLPTGKVFLMGGSSLDPDNRLCPDCSAVWDVNQGTFTRPITPLDDAGIVIDIFCCDHTFLPDGRLLVAGGTQQYNPYTGSAAALLFDPNTEQWTKLPSMNYGRWYPTLIMLGNGRVFSVSGINEQGNGLVANQEIFTGSNWRTFTQPTQQIAMYAGLVLMQDGRIFFSGANFEAYPSETQPRIFTLPSQYNQAIAEQAVNGLVDQDKRNQSATVLLPPAQDQKVMIIGGSDRNSYGSQATNSVNIVDLKAANPTYTPAASLKSARIHHNAILLPDRTVFVCNGSSKGEDNSVIPPAEIYNPATNTWTQVATQKIPRIYHGAALLLPDGTVASVGSAPNFGLENHERRLEIYRPAYMSQPRPAIRNAPRTIGYDRAFTIRTPEAGNIKWVSLIKPMATTHSLDTDQRLVDLPITSKTNNELTVRVTNNRNIAPPGYYMLFITDNNNVPSVASWVRLY